jgi:hypothetical protein
LLIDADKLTGTLSSSPQYPALGDLAWLQVPFNLEDWQVQERTSSAVTDSGAAKSTADSNDYAQGEGSRCSRARDGMAALENAVNAAVALPKMTPRS